LPLAGCASARRRPAAARPRGCGHRGCALAARGGVSAPQQPDKVGSTQALGRTVRMRRARSVARRAFGCAPPRARGRGTSRGADARLRGTNNPRNTQEQRLCLGDVAHSDSCSVAATASLGLARCSSRATHCTRARAQKARPKAAQRGVGGLTRRPAEAPVELTVHVCMHATPAQCKPPPSTEQRARGASLRRCTPAAALLRPLRPGRAGGTRAGRAARSLRRTAAARNPGIGPAGGAALLDALASNTQLKALGLDG
jgi:hypothetical protein